MNITEPKEKPMIQGQYEPSGQQPHPLTAQRSRLLQQHPVLTPIILIIGAVGLCILSLFADTIFPVMALIGVPPVLLCLSVALILAISGVLASIISIIESIDRYRLPTDIFATPKEQSYANRN